MATPRDIRRLAFQALYQLDAHDGLDAQEVREGIASANEERPKPLKDKELAKAFDLAESAFKARRDADRAVVALAPSWPTHRQPATDRALLRLAHYEIVSGVTPPKVAVNEAVELSKEFCGEKSPGFVNGVLDKILKQTVNDDVADTTVEETSTDELSPDEPATDEPATDAFSGETA